MALLGKILVKLGLDSSEFTKGTRDAEKKIGGFASFFKGIGGQITATAAAAFSVGAIINFAKEATALAQKAEGVKVAFDKLNNPTLLDELRKATLNSVDDLQLMQRALTAKNFKIPLDQLATYLAFATKRAQDTGQSVDYLVDSIVTGLGRQSVLILDNLGISAVEIRKEMETAGSMAAAVGNIIKRDMGEAATATETAAIKTGQLSAAWTNFIVEVGKTGFVNSLKTGLSTMLNDFTAIMKSTSMSGFDKFLVFTSIDRRRLSKYDDEVERTAKASKEAATAADGMMKSIKSVEQAQRMLDSMSKDDNREWEKLFRGKLESYIADEKAAKQQAIWRNNSISGIKQQIDELQKLADEETDPAKKKAHAEELKILKQKLATEEKIYQVKDKTEKIGAKGSISYEENELKDLEQRLKFVVTDKDRDDLQGQINAKKIKIKAMLEVVEPKTERQTLEDAIKSYENMQLAIPINVGDPKDIKVAQDEWDRLASLIKQAKEELEKFPKTEDVFPEGSIAAYGAEIAQLNKDVETLTGSELDAALAARSFAEIMQKGASVGWKTQLEQEVQALSDLETALKSATGERKKWLENEIKAQREVVSGLTAADKGQFSRDLEEQWVKLGALKAQYEAASGAERDFYQAQFKAQKAVVRKMQFFNDAVESMGAALQYGLADSLTSLFEALGDPSKFDSSAIIAQLLNPLGDAAIQTGVLAIGISTALEAVKDALVNLFGGGPQAALIAGAALVTLGVAAKIGAAAITKSNGGSGSYATPDTFTGGYSSTGSERANVGAMQLASPEPQVVVLETRVSGSDLLLVQGKEQNRRKR